MACASAALLVLAAYPAAGEEEHRQLGAHVHGHGHLNIAVEGKKLSMELQVPGADIVGFEHEPSTPEQNAAIAEAKAKLANALVLFVPAEKAGCELEQVKVSMDAGHEGENAHEHWAQGIRAGSGQEEAGEHHHSEFHAEYSLSCASPSRLTSMTFDYFSAFSAAQELDISVITPKGQKSFEVKRDKPSLDLSEIM
jgi:hypothetical protein